MIFVENQRLINYRINELVGKINKVFLLNEEKALKLKERLKVVEEYALTEIEKIDDRQLIPHDDSKEIFDTLDLIEEEIDASLNEKNINDVCLDKIDSLIELKEFILAYKKMNPSDLQLNRFKKELVEKILYLLEKQKISIDDTKTFYNNLDIQVVKNVMFESKSKISSKEELMIFSSYLDKINNNEYDKLFKLYLGISYPTEEMNELIVSNITYPSAYKKSTSKLILELADIVYGDFMKSGEKVRAVLKMLKENSGFSGTVYTLFTRSYGIVSLESKKFKEIEKNNEFFDDVVGCIIDQGIYGYENMKNLKFLYILNDGIIKGISATVDIDNNHDLEYIYVKYIGSGYSFHKLQCPHLREIRYETHSSSFSSEIMRTVLVGDYKIVAENSNKILSKIQKAYGKNLIEIENE